MQADLSENGYRAAPWTSSGGGGSNHPTGTHITDWSNGKLIDAVWMQMSRVVLDLPSPYSVLPFSFPSASRHAPQRFQPRLPPTPLIRRPGPTLDLAPPAVECTMALKGLISCCCDKHTHTYTHAHTGWTAAEIKQGKVTLRMKFSYLLKLGDYIA